MPKKKLDRLTPEEQIILKSAQEICDTLDTKGWLAIAAFIQNSIVWPNPSEAKNLEEMVLPYTQAYGAAELAKKIGNFVNSQEEILISLTNKLDEENAPTDDYGN
jgi:hypothetical protein